jgi:glycosyltransferase involved in cell wall biosynthesis
VKAGIQKMRKIIVNGRFLIHRITGVERYAREILVELDRLVRPGEVEMAVPPETEEIPVYKNIKVVKVGKLNNRLWEHISFPLYVGREKGISLNLCNAAPLVSPGIVCIHDVKIKARPEYFSRKFLLWYNLLFKNETKRAKAVITVSQFSKKEICKYYKTDPERIHVIPSSWQHYQRIGYDEGALEKYGLAAGKYYFSLCSLEPNKNFKWIAETARKNPNSIFAVAGSVNKKVFAEGMGFECPDNMKLLGYISDEEAKTLMKESRAFLFPAFYEGFGLPPLEAVSAGAKCVAVSDTEVMHEVFGGSVNYVDPDDYAVKISDFKNMDKNADVLKKYSWKKSAGRLYQILGELES